MSLTTRRLHPQGCHVAVKDQELIATNGALLQLCVRHKTRHNTVTRTQTSVNVQTVSAGAHLQMDPEDGIEGQEPSPDEHPELLEVHVPIAIPAHDTTHDTQLRRTSSVFCVLGC